MNRTYEEEKSTNPNHVETPKFIVEDIFNLIDIKSFNKCWFPFDHNDSQFKLEADELELDYWATHIFDDLGHDFYTTYPSKDTDLMISNPPFNQQNKIIERSFSLIENGYIKSFVLLLPLATLETETRANIYEQFIDKLSVVIIRKRIKFAGHKQTFNKGCCWVCYNIPSLQNEKISWI